MLQRMEGLNYAEMHEVLVVVKTAGSRPSPLAWGALHDVIIKRAHDLKGLLIVADGEPPDAKGRSLMKDALTRMRTLRVAFITDHPVVRMVIDTVVRWTLGERVIKADTIAEALKHFGVLGAAEDDIALEVRRLREVGRAEAAA